VLSDLLNSTQLNFDDSTTYLVRWARQVPVPVLTLLGSYKLRGGYGLVEVVVF
jgi:hypothetical protein